jgi:hypothetical protein
MTATAGQPFHATRLLEARPHTVVDRFLAIFAFVLAGYAIGGKGFAYVGVAPVYIGELSLFAGMVALWCTHSARALLRSPIARLLLAFMLFGALRTLPFLPEYGLNAPRDAVLWGYAAFSLVVAGAVLSRPARLSVLLAQYRRFVPIFLIAAPLFWLTTVLAEKLARWTGVAIPTWPGTAVPIVFVKAGDILVHLSGIAAFLCVGLAGRSPPWRIVLLVFGVALTALSRGGLLAFSIAYGVALLSRPRSRSGWQIAIAALAAVAFLGITDLRVRFPGMDREVSFQQLVLHVQSTAGAGGDATTGGQDLQNTKEWRLAWWATIVNYTILGDYRWMGKGYGINLADDDGFQVTDDNSLRSPHNVHMTFLARSGVIGLVLWIGLQGAWLVRMWRARRDARERGQTHWFAVLTFLVAYWLALLVNGTFDVYLEGPAGGIWFWSIFGIGLAAECLYRQLEQTELVRVDQPIALAEPLSLPSQ